MGKRTGWRMGTLAVHGGERRPGPEGSLIFPIFQGTVYRSEPGTGYHDQKYIRLNNTPTQRYLHDKLASLEGAEAAVAAGSGMAAMSATLLALLRSGDHVLAPDVLYGGTHDFLVEDAPGHGITCTFIDPGRAETWADALTQRTKMILVETISNPLMRVPRLRAIAAFARERGLVSVIDSTFASPVNCRPIELGFDVVFHSATKYLNGHSDLVGGCVMGSRERVEKIRRTLNHYGGSMDPHAAFLLARGLKTLVLRVRAHNAVASALARFLASHPRVAEVNYPGLPEHPDHRHASEVLSGFGGMLSFRPAGGEAAAVRLLDRLDLPAVAPSLGGVESLVTRPAVTSHAGMTGEARRRAGIGEDLIRVSCGVEDPEDLIEDFGRALDAL